MQFAAGQLVNALGVMVACHLEQCSHCRKQVRLFEQVGGELMEEVSPADADPELFNRIMERIRSGDFSQNEHPPASPLITNVPRPLSRFVQAGYDELPWSGFTNNIRHYDLPISDNRYTARFYRISAGHELPVHTHKGNEFTLVMTGSFSDKAGSYHTGDFVLADQTTNHQPRAHDDQDCICFAVTDAPLRMTGFFGRLLNPFLS